MRPVRAVGLYLLFVFVGGALLAPWVYKLAEAAGHVLPGLASPLSKPFPRYVSRCLLALAMGAIWPLLRATGLASWREMGLSQRPDAGSLLVYGFSLGLISLACVVAVTLAAGVRVPSLDLTPASVLGRSAKAALTAVVVASLEEFLFRGALFGALRKTFHWVMALVLSSGLYALLHFLDGHYPGGQVAWDSGITTGLGMAAAIPQTEQFVPRFLNLVLIGFILGLAYQRSGSLHFSIGLHAGWVFWLKAYGSMTGPAGMGASTAFFGTSKLINGWLSFIMLLFVLGGLWWIFVPEDRQAGWKEKRLFI